MEPRPVQRGNGGNGLEGQKLFIVHAADDMALISPHIIDVLEKEYHIPCVVAERDFHGGKPTITSIIDAIQTAYKTVVVLTEKSMKSNWVKYETLLALERSQRLKVLSLVVLLLNTSFQPKDLLFGVLSNAMMIHVDINEDNWKANMVEEIKREVPLNKAIVMTNLATGQAWSHFTGYCNVVFPHLQEKIKASAWYKANPDRFPLMEFNLIPHSAKSCGKLQELDDRIKFIGNLEDIVVSRGSYPTRPYIVSVYKLLDPESGKDIFFVCQIPNTVSILNKAENGCEDLFDVNTTANIDKVPNMQISAGERNLQVARLYYTLNRVLNHPKNRDCNGLARLILYDDNKEDAVDVLLPALREELAKQNLPPDSHYPCCNTSSVQNACEDRNRRVYIESDVNSRDLEFASDLTEFLLNQGFLIWDNALSGRTHFENLENATRESKWSIFLLSKQSTESENFPLLNLKYRNVLHQSIQNNELCVIPVLDGIDGSELLYELGWVTYLNRCDSNFKERLLQTLKLESIPMESTVPATDVHQGLAWAYVMNYLSLVLDEHLERMETLPNEKNDLLVYKKLFIAVPSSCFLKSLDKDDDGNLLDSRFQSEKEEHFVTKGLSGVNNRKYQLHLFKLKGPTKEFIVAVEFPNSVLCLHEMSCLKELSGLSKEELYNEAMAFCTLAQKILSVSKFKDKARLVYYDDSETGVADALLQTLEKEENVQI